MHQDAKEPESRMNQLAPLSSPAPSAPVLVAASGARASGGKRGVRDTKIVPTAQCFLINRLAQRMTGPLLAHQARAADHIGGEDGGEAAGGGHCSGTPALPRPSMMRSYPARPAGLSSPGAPPRNLEMVKVGLIAKPA
jgi:hypothetical protein